MSSASDPAVASQDTETSCSATKDRVFYPKTACSPSMQPIDREVITGIRGSALHQCKNSHDEMPTLLPPKIPVISFTYLNLLPHLNIYCSLNILPRFVPSVWNASPLYLLLPTPYVQPMPILQGPYQICSVKPSSIFVVRINPCLLFYYNIGLNIYCRITTI